MKRKVFTSRKMSLKASLSGGKVEIYSFFPIDKHNCECQQVIHQWKEKLAMLSGNGKKEAIARQEFIVCPKSKVGMKRYKITCNNCGETMGYCWAGDETLTDWCDLHYTSWVGKHKIKKKGKVVDHEYLWRGCFGHHISPITEQLCWECICGEDTRDFRANMTLPGQVAHKIELKNKIGREFGKANSKFKASVVASDVIPFKRGGH